MINKTVASLLVVAIAMIAVDALYLPALLAWATLDPVGVQETLVPNIQTLDGVEIVFRVLSFVAFSAWLFAAGKNLVAAGHDDLEFSAGSRVWWFFVPFANLVMPYRGMAEMWRVSHGDAGSDATPPLVAIWWAVWLGGNILSTVLTRFGGAESDLSSTLVIGGTKLLQAVMAIILLTAITRAQARLSVVDRDLEEVFT